MKQFFTLDSPFMQTLTKIGQVMILNLLWLVCCVPVVTAGASTAALYQMLFHIREDKDCGPKAFFRAFSQNFKKATLLWLIVLGSGNLVLLFRLASMSLQAGEAVRDLLFGAFAALVFVWAFGMQYVFPLTAYFENTVPMTLRNAYLTGMRKPLQSFFCCLVTLIPAIACVANPDLFLHLLYVWLLIVPGAIAYWKSGKYLREFREMIDESEEKA